MREGVGWPVGLPPLRAIGDIHAGHSAIGMVHFVHWTARTGEPSTEWMVTILEIVPQNHYYVPRTYVRRETLRTSIFRYERLRRIRRGCYGLVMSLKGRRKRSLAEWHWLVLGSVLRLARRNGQFPSGAEIAKDLRCNQRWAHALLAQLRDEGLVVLVGGGAGSGWQPTAEGLHWRGAEMPTLEPGRVPPRAARWAGVGAIRAWKRWERLRERLAAAEVFDRDAVSGGGEFEG